MIFQGALQRLNSNVFKLNDLVLLSGSKLEIQINGVWLSGFLEMYGDFCCWFSDQGCVPVILKDGITARFQDKKV